MKRYNIYGLYCDNSIRRLPILSCLEVNYPINGPLVEEAKHQFNKERYMGRTYDAIYIIGQDSFDAWSTRELQ